MASQVEHIKWVANRFMVDGFGFTNSRCKHYFLTHFHSDHTVGLTRGFHGGIIYCTQVTKNLLLKDFRLTPSCQIEVLEYEQPITVQGVQVTAIPANHCPGACMLLFEVPADAQRSTEPEVILHTGDFSVTRRHLELDACRWQSYMMQSSALKRLKVNTLYLDTTYALPRYRLPPQEQCILAMVDQMRQALKEQPATLFVIAAYRIGKEKVFLTAARLLGCKVWVSPAKRGVLQLLDLSTDDMALLADSPEQAQLHVVSWGLKPESLQQYLSNGAAGEEAMQQEGGSEAEAMQGAGLEQEPEAVEEGLFGQEPDAASVGPEPPAAPCDGEDAAHTLPPPGSEARGQQWKRVIGIRATGWTLRKGGKLHVWKQGPIALMSVPYSEHSSWDELCDCVRSLRPRKLVPTVNVETPLKFKAMLDKFAPLMDLSQDKSRIHFYMRSPHTLQAQGAGAVARAGPGAEQGAGPEPQPEVWCRTSQRESIDLTPSGSSREETWEGDGRPCDAPVSELRGCKEEEEEEEEVQACDHVPGSVRQGAACALTAAAAAGSRVLPAAAVDLSLIDVQEQVRIYASIVGQRALSCSPASGSGCRAQVQGGAAAAGSQASRKRKPAAKQQRQQRQEGQKQGLEQGSKRQACKAVESSVQSDLEGKGSRQHGIKAFFAQSIKP